MYATRDMPARMGYNRAATKIGGQHRSNRDRSVASSSPGRARSICSMGTKYDPVALASPGCAAWSGDGWTDQTLVPTATLVPPTNTPVPVFTPAPRPTATSALHGLDAQGEQRSQGWRRVMTYTQFTGPGRAGRTKSQQKKERL